MTASAASTSPFRLRPPLLTLLLILVNVALYVWEVAHGVDAMEPDLDMMTHWGANIGALTLTGDPWRLLTSMFLHIGVLHLLLNMVSLLFLGSIVELNFGRANFAVIYLLSGLGGSLMSALYHAAPSATSGLADFMPFAQQTLTLTVSAGASGAIMGLAASAIALRLVETNAARASTHPFKGKEILFLILINVFYGWKTEGTDNACHVGGLIAGAVVGLILAICLNQSAIKRAAAQLVVMAAGLAVVGFGVNSRATDEDLLDIRQQLTAQQRHEARIETMQQQRQDATALAQADSRTLPPPVDAAEAAGVAIPISADAGNFIVGPGGKRAYVTDGDANTLSVIDLASHKVIQVIKGGDFPHNGDGCPDNTCRGVGADSVIVNADETRAWVTSMRADAVAVVDLKAGTVQTAIPVGRYPTRIVQSSDGDAAYTFNSADDTISAVDLKTGTVRGEAFKIYSGDTRPDYAPGRQTLLALSPDNRQLYANSDSDQALLVLDTASGKPVQRPSLAGAPVDMALTDGGKSLSVLDSQGITQIDTTSFELKEEWRACNELSDTPAFAFNPDGKRVALWQRDANNVRVVSLVTHKTLGLYPSGHWPGTLAFTGDGKQLLSLYDGALHVQDLAKRMADEERPNDDFFCWNDPNATP